jgi:Fe-S-cluster formation regulator IscX/YfhJ
MIKIMKLKANDCIVTRDDMRVWRVVERIEDKGYILANPNDPSVLRFCKMGLEMMELSDFNKYQAKVKLCQS